MFRSWTMVQHTCVFVLLKSVDSNSFALLKPFSTAQRTEAQLFALKYVAVKQSIFIKSCKPCQECSKCSKYSERCTRRAARVRAKVRVLNLTTLRTASEHNTNICGQQLFRSVRAPQHSSENRSAALRNKRRFREAKHFYIELQIQPRVFKMLQEQWAMHKASGKGSR